MRQARFFVVLSALVFICGVWGCAPDMPHVVRRYDLSNAPYCVVLIVDALGPDVLQNLLDKGDLPNIKKHIIDRGLRARNMISVFPSITAGAITTILTGLYPSRHQIPNFTWVDRITGKYRCYVGTDIIHFESDLYKHARTIFQYLPKEETASFGLIQGHQAGKDEGLVFSALNPFHESAPLSHVALSDFFSKVGLGKGVPHLLTYYEWNVDVHGHREGKFSEKVRNIMRRTDHQFGKIVQAYQERGLYDKTYFVLSSDHGLADVQETFMIDQAFHNAGFKRKLISYNVGESLFPTTWARADSIWFSQEKVFGYNAVVGSSGGGLAAIDLVLHGGLDKHGKPDKKLWPDHPVYEDLLKYDLGQGALVKERWVNVIRFVRHMKPVDFFIVRENRPASGQPAKVLIVAENGLARITRKLDPAGSFVYSYQVVKGNDPLGYTGDAQINTLVGSAFYDGYRWLNATASSAYPDAPVLLTSIFDTSRSGTIIVSMKPGWGVNATIKGKHGGYNRHEMIAVFCIAGPGLSRGKIETARIVDITPTLLALLGEDPQAKDFDGRPIPQVMEKVRR